MTDSAMAHMEQRIAALEGENSRLKQLWFSDADPEETEYADEYRAAMGEKK